jgi:hypothetical protein
MAEVKIHDRIVFCKEFNNLPENLFVFGFFIITMTPEGLNGKLSRPSNLTTSIILPITVRLRLT